MTRGVFVAAAIVLLLAGCAAPRAVAGDTALTREDLPDISASSQQLDELKDGVTRDEYAAAFSRFEGCMKAAGQSLFGVEEGDYVITYSLLASAYDSGEFDRCYLTEFQQVDERWQFLNKDMSSANRAYQACLTDAGLSPKQSSEDVWAQLREAGLDPEECAQVHQP